MSVAALVRAGLLLVLATSFLQLGHPLSLLVAGTWSAALIAVALPGLGPARRGALGLFALATAVALVAASGALALLVQGELPPLGELSPLIATGLLWIGRAGDAGISRGRYRRAS